ncbi:hydroxysqualene dehydroxylase HpnE [Accumulibacter sp.]|uniref:hydroxysqualene dehydroxylase HpnE n=1 Tax=Accumulibacter sp. TaxID=2053492 RepID=UPI0025FEE94D|nr:hydroxysqualene dehydroxylase HpnE [Accumulibacter sp.]MCM8594879.1 hydroxysqualene dehydroxylase HpnE [Accumulibacter sp.]MCM8626268.1 hydroxysqualene dehydroxylase HpnE [Accumulibacter sp.]MDS4049025.1 hydroxysqualene dehydroxylase HpnE [Accumulibacter sp.]
MNVAIVGGGWAGLAAAVELAAAGVGVTVFESARQIGGRARSVRVGGEILDNGQHILSGAYRETLRLIAVVGVEVERVVRRLPLELRFASGGRTSFQLRLPRLRPPLDLAAGLCLARGATLSGKFAAIRLMRFLAGRDYRLDEDLPLGELLDRLGQHGALRDCLWEPLCLAALNTAPGQASAQVFARVVADTLGGGAGATDLLLPAADLDRLFPEAAGRFIGAHRGEIRLGHRVEAIDPGPSVHGERFSGVVIAVGAQHAPALLARHAATQRLASLLAGYRFEPIATVYCGYPPGLRLPLPMLGLDPRTPGRIGQWAFDRGALCGTPGVIAFVLSAHGAWEELDNDRLARTLHRELADALGAPLPAPLWQRVIREQRATFACRPGLPRPSPDTGLPGVWLAGDYVCAEYPATLEAAVRSGVAAARAVLADRPAR